MDGKKREATKIAMQTFLEEMIAIHDGDLVSVWGLLYGWSCQGSLEANIDPLSMVNDVYTLERQRQKAIEGELDK